MRKAAVIRTGVANTASVFAALKRLGLEAEFAETPEQILHSEVAVLPGVGAFQAGMAALERFGLDAALKERIRKDKPTLAVCLGMQLLFGASEESPGVSGLGIFPGTVQRFVCADKVPQLGWNQIAAGDGCRILKSGAVYFANSYCVKQCPAGVNAAGAEYEEKFVAAFEAGNLLACQFHPELSGTLGSEILSAWLQFALAGEIVC